LRAVWLAAAAVVILSGCSREPEAYPPPPQRRRAVAPDPPLLRPYVAMRDPEATAHIVRDVVPALQGGAWRWTRRRPELRFRLGSTEGLKLAMRFSIVEATFRNTGPVRLAFFVNQQMIEKVQYGQPGIYQFEKPVPSELLQAHAVNHVAVEIDKVWIAPHDREQLGFILIEAGFRK